MDGRLVIVHDVLGTLFSLDEPIRILREARPELDQERAHLVLFDWFHGGVSLLKSFADIGITTADEKLVCTCSTARLYLSIFQQCVYTHRRRIQGDIAARASSSGRDGRRQCHIWRQRGSECVSRAIRVHPRFLKKAHSTSWDARGVSADLSRSKTRATAVQNGRPDRRFERQPRADERLLSARHRRCLCRW